MNQINQISNDPLQTLIFSLPNGNQVSMTIYFIPMQYGWFITNLTYGDFVLNGVRITNNPNILRQFKNQIDFGLACFSASEREPSQQNDFATDASSLYILTSDEVQEYEDFLNE